MVERLPQVLAVRPREGGVEIDLRIAPELPCFVGHFPDLPIVPGVVQLDWALHFARAQGITDVPAARAFQVKFRAIIRPRDQLTLVLRHESRKQQVTFEYRRGPVVYSSGQFFVGGA